LKWGEVLAINDGYDEDAVIKAVATALNDFYNSLISSLDKLSIKKIMRRKNPYLFRAKAMKSASQIVEALLSAFVSSSEETIFGNAFFEPIATVASQGEKALAEGIDITVNRGDDVYGIASKSGTSVFNAASRKKQEQNFLAANKLAKQAKKNFHPIIGYGYGVKRSSDKGIAKFYTELAGQEYWAELTGDQEFYIKLIHYMEDLPETYIGQFNDAYLKASNRLLKEFTNEYCQDDGSIDWDKLVRTNSGK
jgi:hypothetical protein